MTIQCREHPFYSGMQKPETACPSCWEHYVAMSPDRTAILNRRQQFVEIMRKSSAIRKDLYSDQKNSL